MKHASYLSRLAQGAGERRALLPPRTLFSFIPAPELGFVEIESVQSLAARELRAKSPTPRSEVGESPVQGVSARPEATDVTAENVTAVSPIVPVYRPVSPGATRPRVGSASDVAPPPTRVRSGASPEARSGIGPAAKTSVSRSPEADRPVTKSAPVLPSQAVVTNLSPPKTGGSEPQTPPTAASLQHHEMTAQGIPEAKTKSDRIGIEPGPVHDASHTSSPPGQNLEPGRSASQPRKNSSSPASVPLIPRHPDEQFVSPPSRENRKAAADEGSQGVRIGALHVRINPPLAPEAPKPMVPRSAALPRPAVSLARGFGSFGLVQG